MKFLWNRKIGLLFIALLVISALYPTYFISDDWEHLDSIYKNGSNIYIRYWIYRIPALYYSHTTLFPLFQSENFFLGNLICWFFFFLGTLLILETFGILEKLKKEPSWFFLSFFIMLCFNHNNFEFIFWPSFMVNFPGFFLIGLGFFLTKKYVSWKTNVIRALIWTISFYFTESLFFMGVLLEIAYVLWFRCDQRIKDNALYLVKELFLAFVLLVVSKVILTYLRPYGYAAAWGFKPHLFYQTMSLIFLHDYYKVRWLTGSIALISYLGLSFLILKKMGRLEFFKKVVIFSVIILASTSYYFMIMNYSARRALGGPLFISWGLICIGYLGIWTHKDRSKLRTSVLIILPLSWIIHSSYVIKQKIGDRTSFRENAHLIRERMKNEALPVSISRDDIMRNVNTGWNLVNEKQTSGWVRHFFRKEELENLSY